jgi:hypothetical protein
MKIEYTIEDCFALYNILKVGEGSFDVDDFYDEVIDKARKTITTRELKEDELEKLIRTWLLMHNGLRGTGTIADFLFETEFNKVALYINEELLNMFVKWRLKIAK